MITLINRFSKYSIIIFGFLAITLSYAQDERAEDISILDVDANGEVDALTDGLLLLRSMFELTDDALVTGVVDSTNCKECDAEGIDQYISTLRESTFGKLSAYDDQNISGSSLEGTTLTIGIENGNSETVDLSSLEDGVGITSDQASAITANTAKTGITSDQASAITTNTAKTGITSDQASAITANTEKVGTDDQNISGLELNGTTLTIGIDRGESESIDLAPLTNCSVTQDGSSAIISCNDGTSAVLASAGTVITYPVGQATSVDISEIPTGAIVIKDATDVILGEFYYIRDPGYVMKLAVNVSHLVEVLLFIKNDNDNETIMLNTRNAYSYLQYNGLDCTGSEFIINSYTDVLFGPNNTYFIAASTNAIPQIFKSYYNYTTGNCMNEEEASTGAYPAMPYYLSDELTNAVYPISLEQLP